MDGPPVIRTRGLTKRYGDHIAVDHLDLEVRRGEVFGLLGPNGAGKTTTILMLLGLSEPSEGEAEVLGLDPTRQPLQVKQRVGYLPDNVGFYEQMSGRQNLRYTARLNGLRDQEAEGRVQDLLEQARLARAADLPVGAYSRGMRQRLGIADALVKDPEVVILDEPTIAIDPEGVVEVLALIRSLAERQGVTVLLSSHLLHQVQEVCDRVGIFVTGRLLTQGPVRELAQQLFTGVVTVEAGVDAEPQRVEEVLTGLPGVQQVEQDPRDPRLWLVTGSEDIANQVARAVAAEGLPIRHLRRRGEELDELYRRYFQEEEVARGRVG
ncbi:MAG: ABC transporter ATP-binding protein [Actinomycetota bacterium]|nr:ABC transporter ATP-binding protein [Actinomycetota bacterium]